MSTIGDLTVKRAKVESDLISLMLEMSPQELVDTIDETPVDEMRQLYALLALAKFTVFDECESLTEAETYLKRFALQ